MAQTEQSAPRQRGWWYPYIFLAFFVVVVSVNGTMAFFATSTFSGLSTADAYEKGLTYNRNIAQAKAQAEMGWSVEIAAVPAGEAKQAQLSVTIHDRAGHPIDGLEVRGTLSRPTVHGYDRPVVLAALGDGHYGDTVALPLAGEWDLEVVAIGKDASYQTQRRFLLP